MILANGETLLREWTYATKQEGREKSTCTLSVTNKRIVASEDSNHHVSHQEIPVNAVKTLSFSHTILSKLKAILMIIFGILFAVVGVVLGMKAGQAEASMKLVIMLPFLLLGFIFVCVGFYLLNQSAFSMTITTEGWEGSSLVLGAQRIVGKGPRKAKKIKVKVVDSIVLEIIDELGALIINSKNENK